MGDTIGHLTKRTQLLRLRAGLPLAFSFFLHGDVALDRGQELNRTGLVFMCDYKLRKRNFLPICSQERRLPHPRSIADCGRDRFVKELPCRPGRPILSRDLRPAYFMLLDPEKLAAGAV